jgi:hypothetical protein
MAIPGLQETDSTDGHRFQLLSEEEFQLLSTVQKIEYLRRAILACEAINRQIDAYMTLPRHKAE